MTARYFFWPRPFYGGSGFCKSSASISCRNIFQMVRMPLVAQLQASELTFLPFAFSDDFLCSEGRDNGQWNYLSIVSCSLVAIEATFEPSTLFLRNSGCDAFGDFEQSQKYRWQLLLPWSFRRMSHRLRSNDAPAYLRVLQEGRFFPDGRASCKNIVVLLVFSYIPIEFWDLLISNTFVPSQILISFHSSSGPASVDLPLRPCKPPELSG